MAQLTREQFIQEYQDGNRDFQWVDLSGVDLSNLRDIQADFTGAVLIGTDFSKTGLSSNFSNAIMDKAILFDIYANETNFTGASLKGANFERSILDNCKFISSDLSNSNFREVFVVHSNFDNANMSGADLTAGTMQDSTFNKTNMRGADIAATSFSGSYIDKALNMERSSSYSSVYGTPWIDGNGNFDCEGFQSLFGGHYNPYDYDTADQFIEDILDDVTGYKQPDTDEYQAIVEWFQDRQ